MNLLKTLKLGTKVDMIVLKNMKLKTKLLGGFLIFAVTASIFSFVGNRLAFMEITEHSIPTLAVLGQAGGLAKSIRGETLEFVATGEKKTLQEFTTYIPELDDLSAQRETIAIYNQQDETMTLDNLFLLTEKLSDLGQEIIQSHGQTLEHLEALEAIEQTAEGVFEDVNDIINTEIARNLAAGDLDELQEDAIPSKELLVEFIEGTRSLQVEALEFAASGEAEAIEQFENAEVKLEAARAGEHGKGFAVVAVEVRNLAEQSKQSTAQVKAILNEIQRATNAAVMATEEGTKGVDAGVQLTEQTRETIQQLATSIGESSSAAQQIVVNAQQQTTGIEQIALAMDNINQATIQNLTSVRQAEKSAQDLSSVAQQMEALVARYKLN